MKPSLDVIILGSKPIKGMKSRGPLSNIHINKSQSILENQIKNLYKKLNINQIIYVGGYGFEDIKVSQKIKNITWIHNNQFNTKNNGYNLKLALQKSNSENLFILFNKTLFSHQIFNFFDFTISQIFMSNSSDYKIGAIISKNTDIISNLFYNLDNRCCGLYYLTQQEALNIKNIVTSYDVDNLFLFEVLNKSIDLGSIYKPKIIPNQKLVFQITNNQSIENCKKYYAKYFSV